MILESLGRGAIGMMFLILVCYALSNNRRAIDWKLVIIGLVVQICFALGVLRVNFVKIIFGWLSAKFVEVINIGHKGIEFIFGNLADPSQLGVCVCGAGASEYHFLFCFVGHALLFGHSSKSSLCICVAVEKAWYFGPESTSTAANIFLGQTEAPLMIRPFLEK
jgi:CNT family concentrative nucleoside transporter